MSDLEWTFDTADLRTALVRSVAVLRGEDAARCMAADLMRPHVESEPLHGDLVPLPDRLSDADADRRADRDYYRRMHES